MTLLNRLSLTKMLLKCHNINARIPIFFKILHFIIKIHFPIYLDRRGRIVRNITFHKKWSHKIQTTEWLQKPHISKYTDYSLARGIRMNNLPYLIRENTPGSARIENNPEKQRFFQSENQRRLLWAYRCTSFIDTF